MNNPKFTFIDLFAGIGGFHFALKELRGKCVFASEWDKNAQKTYEVNHNLKPLGDITKQEIKIKFQKNLISSVQAFLVRLFRLLVTKKVSLIVVERYFLILNK